MLLKKRKKKALDKIGELKGTKFEAAWEQEFTKLVNEAEEILETIKSWQHKQKKQIEERLKKIKKR